jgi:hypothetical protein
MTAGTGDAAEMLARLAPDGDFTNATSELGNLVRPLAQTKEAHHFYPLLFYFRFEEPFYSVSRFSFILLDLTTLIDTTLDRQKHGAFVNSAPVVSLRRGALLLLETLDQHFPTGHDGRADAAEPRSYAESYAAALETLRRTGIETRPDAGSYAEQRSRWNPIVRRVAPALGYSLDEIECRRPQKKAARLQAVDTRPAG